MPTVGVNYAVNENFNLSTNNTKGWTRWPVSQGYRPDNKMHIWCHEIVAEPQPGVPGANRLRSNSPDSASAIYTINDPRHRDLVLERTPAESVYLGTNYLHQGNGFQIKIGERWQVKMTITRLSEGYDDPDSQDYSGPGFFDPANQPNLRIEPQLFLLCPRASRILLIGSEYTGNPGDTPVTVPGGLISGKSFPVYVNVGIEGVLPSSIWYHEDMTVSVTWNFRVPYSLYGQATTDLLIEDLVKPILEWPPMLDPDGEQFYLAVAVNESDLLMDTYYEGWGLDFAIHPGWELNYLGLASNIPPVFTEWTPPPPPTPAPPPTIISFDPASGRCGEFIEITGTNFQYVETITFGGGVVAYPVWVNDDYTVLSVQVPQGAETGAITVCTYGGLDQPFQCVTSDDIFSVLPGPCGGKTDPRFNIPDPPVPTWYGGPTVTFPYGCLSDRYHVSFTAPSFDRGPWHIPQVLGDEYIDPGVLPDIATDGRILIGPNTGIESDNHRWEGFGLIGWTLEIKGGSWTDWTAMSTNPSGQFAFYHGSEGIEIESDGVTPGFLVEDWTVLHQFRIVVVFEDIPSWDSQIVTHSWTVTRLTIIDPVPNTYNNWMTYRKMNYPKDYYAAGVTEPGYFGTPPPPGVVPTIGDSFPLVYDNYFSPTVRYEYTGPEAEWLCTGGGGSTGPPAPPTPVDVWLPPRLAN